LDNIETSLHFIRQRLENVSDAPVLDAQVLLGHVVGKERACLLAHTEERLSSEQQYRLERALVRLESGEPLPYVLGHWEFYGLDFILSPATLIPRTETEMLVEESLAWLHKHPTRRFCMDAGTGTGCIAITMAVKFPDLIVMASDLSLDALKIAKINAQRHGVSERVVFVQADLCLTTGRLYDIICANLPYIPTNTLVSLPVYQREPVSALDGGVDGLNLIRRMIQIAPMWLAKDGLLLLEIEASQGENAIKIARKAFPDAKVDVKRDLAGHERLLRVKRGSHNLNS